MDSRDASRYFLKPGDYKVELPRTFLESYPQYAVKGIGMHLAVLIEPYLSRVFQGIKKFESRFSTNRVAPYDVVKAGDIIFIKKSSSDVLGFFIAGKVEFHVIDDIKRAKEEWAGKLCIDSDDFWDQKANARYLTVIEITNLKKTQPIAISKKDYSAWVVLTTGNRMKVGTL